MQPDIASPDAVAAVGLEHKVLLASDRHAPVVFLVHGRAGNFEVMWTFRRCIPEGVHCIAVQAPLADPLGGFSWWQVAPTISGERGDPLQAGTILFSAMERAIAYYNLESTLRLAYGFSQGAGLLSIVVQERPAFFSGAALLAGFVIKKDATPQPPLPSIFIAHGTLDETVPIDKAVSGAEFLRGRGYDVTFVQDEVGHKIGSAAMRELKTWTAARAR